MQGNDHKRYVTPYFQGLIQGLSLGNTPPTEIAVKTGYTVRTIYNYRNKEIEEPKEEKRGGGRKKAYGEETAQKIIDYSLEHRDHGARKIATIEEINQKGLSY